jgi:LmbE family N-acetylglucosaminyl deacetylase
MNVLILAAHPDDELLGVGGTAAVHAERGDRVTLAVMCEGISMRYDDARHAVVRDQLRKAADILGVESIHVGDLPDQKLDTLPLSDVIGHVERLVATFAPETIYGHFGGDVNRDHQVLAEALLVAARPYSAPGVREILMFETPSSTEWASPTVLPVFQPTVFVDISTTLERKIEAFLSYEAEVRAWPHPRSAEALRDRARYWGSLVNRTAAEPFVQVRSLR